ncbi:MerR type regulator [Sutcliffiella rhizosphaerae]|uniref:Uncharacterized protein n=1 Tax=Sutcliffiella rhizosphaerae TaxID=2880967 RepID=A0ABM8YSH9_9BACI|nr:MerR type regulator [Sutcliffiella rhizosphaerae]CAG9622802.1 hypothetical protein BACCIP111883_03593 [Sutcliffiella rhizosphaerae]
MKQDFLWKTVILLIGLVVIIGLFIGFRVFDHQLAVIDRLQATIEQQENQISLLEASNQRYDIEYQEDESQLIEAVITSFVTAIYDVRQDNYDIRLSEAELVMTPSMLEQYFPENEGEVKLEMEYQVGEVHIYPSLELERALVLLEGTTVNLSNGKREQNRITLEVNLIKDDGKWMVQGFQQLYAETL